METSDETISQEQIDNMNKIASLPIETDEDYLALAELVEDESIRDRIDLTTEIDLV